MNEGAGEWPLSIKPPGQWGSDPHQHNQASAVFQLQAPKSSKTRQERPWLTSGPAALTNDPLWHQPIGGDHDPEGTRLESWWMFCGDPPLGPSLKIPPLKALRKDDAAALPSGSMPMPFPSSSSLPQASCLYLSPKLQGLCFCPCNVFWSHFFYSSLHLPLWLSK